MGHIASQLPTSEAGPLSEEAVVHRSVRFGCDLQEVVHMASARD
jgi:hypothetical protein